MAAKNKFAEKFGSLKTFPVLCRCDRWDGIAFTAGEYYSITHIDEHTVFIKTNTDTNIRLSQSLFTGRFSPSGITVYYEQLCSR